MRILKDDLVLIKSKSNLSSIILIEDNFPKTDTFINTIIEFSLIAQVPKRISVVAIGHFPVESRSAIKNA